MTLNFPRCFNGCCQHPSPAFQYYPCCVVTGPCLKPRHKVPDSLVCMTAMASTRPTNLEIKEAIMSAMFLLWRHCQQQCEDLFASHSLERESSIKCRPTVLPGHEGGCRRWQGHARVPGRNSRNASRKYGLRWLSSGLEHNSFSFSTRRRTVHDGIDADTALLGACKDCTTMAWEYTSWAKNSILSRLMWKVLAVACGVTGT